MTFTDTAIADGTLTVAAPGLMCMGNTPYSGSTFRCEGDNGRAKEAVHTWEGRHYCAYHSPFDVVDLATASLAPEPVQSTPVLLDTASLLYSPQLPCVYQPRKITPVMIPEIRTKREDGASVRDLAQEYGVSTGTIRRYI